jgi:hypothetical protein
MTETNDVGSCRPRSPSLAPNAYHAFSDRQTPGISAQSLGRPHTRAIFLSAERDLRKIGDDARITFATEAQIAQHSSAERLVSY